MRRQSDLIMVILASLFAFLLASSQAAIPFVFKVPFGMLMVLYVPGYVLFEALFPFHKGMRLERVVFSIGLSLAFSAITGIVLFVLRVSIRADTVAFVLLIITCVLSIWATWRRRKALLSHSRAIPDEAVILTNQPQRGLTLTNVLFAAGAFVLTVAAFWVASLPTTQSGFEGYTTLWLVPQTKQIASNYNLDAPLSDIVELGFTSQEFSLSTFNVAVSINGKVVREWSDIQLVPGETWYKQFRLPANLPPNNEIRAQLFKKDAPGVVYRSVNVRNFAGISGNARPAP